VHTQPSKVPRLAGFAYTVIWFFFFLFCTCSARATHALWQCSSAHSHAQHMSAATPPPLSLQMKPTVLIGVSTMAGSFSSEVLRVRSNSALLCSWEGACQGVQCRIHRPLTAILLLRAQLPSYRLNLAATHAWSVPTCRPWRLSMSDPSSCRCPTQPQRASARSKQLWPPQRAGCCLPRGHPSLPASTGVAACTPPKPTMPTSSQQWATPQC
jgi:hypothetical protein